MVGDLLPLDQQETPRLLEQGPELVQGLEPHLEVTVDHSCLQPGVPESLAVAIEAVFPSPLVRLDHAHPFLPLAEDVVVRQRQELISVPVVPIDDHLGVVVAVAPE